MEHAATNPDMTGDSSDLPIDPSSGVAEGSPEPQSEERRAPRFTLLIRAAKLVTSHGEFVCVVSDVSETGVAVKLFHDMPTGDPVELHMPGGGVYELKNVWEKDNQAVFQFAEPVDVGRLVNEVGQYPKRGLRLGLSFPIRIKTLTQTAEGIVENLSQQGARFECDSLFAIDQTLRIESVDGGVVLKEIGAKVRWRREKQYGVVFDDTLTLSDFARFAARLQCPQLLS